MPNDQQLDNVASNSLLDASSLSASAQLYMAAQAAVWGESAPSARIPPFKRGFKDYSWYSGGRKLHVHVSQIVAFHL